MVRRFVIVASSFSVVALLALANPAGAASPNMVTGTVSGTQGFVGDGSVSYSGVALSDGSTSNATLFFTSGTLVSGSFFVVGGNNVLATTGAVHKGSVTATGSDSNGMKATITISSVSITPASVAATTGQTNYAGNVKIHVW
jgi:hypothetical protein